MKKIILLLILATAIALPVVVIARGAKTVHVRGYTRKDGTRVHSYMRSPPTGHSRGNHGVGGSAFNDPYSDDDGVPDVPEAPSNREDWARIQKEMAAENAELDKAAQVKREKFIASLPPKWSGKCLSVSNGYGLSVMLNGKPQKVLLYGVACPAVGQNYDDDALAFIQKAAQGKVLTIYPKGADGSLRVTAWVFVGTECLNKSLIQNGLAWYAKKSAPGETKLAAIEDEARKAHLKIWSEPSPVPPWEYMADQ